MADVKKSPHVPNQYLGYSLQTTRCLARLLDADAGSFVSIEVFDDVGIKTATGNLIAEQDKSTTDGNPVSDRSVDLWKTFSNWIDSAKDGSLDPHRTQFAIYVSLPKSGTFVKSFSEAKTISEAKKALQEARKVLWGDPPSFPEKAKVADGLAPYVKNVFESKEDLVAQIISSFSFSTAIATPHKDLEERMRKCFTPEEILGETLKYALGWVKTESDMLLEKNKPAVISVDKFRRVVTEYVRKHDRRSLLASYAKNPDPKDIAGDLQLRIYVRQLELVEVDNDLLEQAVIDFLKAAVDRTHWSKQGWVDEEDFDEYEEGLTRAWRTMQLRASVMMREQGLCAQGQLVYSDCSMHTAKVAGLDVPRHFTPGSFHALADNQEIGWHPDYKEKLKKLSEGGGEDGSS